MELFLRLIICTSINRHAFIRKSGEGRNLILMSFYPWKTGSLSAASHFIPLGITCWCYTPNLPLFHSTLSFSPRKPTVATLKAESHVHGFQKQVDATAIAYSRMQMVEIRSHAGWFTKGKLMLIIQKAVSKI